MADALHEAIEQAIDAEIRIRDFYLNSVEKVESELAREILTFLASQETRHIADIQDFQKALDGSLPHFDVAERTVVVTKEKAREFFGSHRAVFESTVKASPHDAEIYRLGLDMEKLGYVFYQKQAKAATDERAKKLFSFLEQEEIVHYELVEKMSDFFLHPVDWFVKEEKWMFEG